MENKDTNNTYLDPNILYQLDKDLLRKIGLLCKTLSEIQDYTLKGGNQIELRKKIVSTRASGLPNELDKL